MNHRLVLGLLAAACAAATPATAQRSYAIERFDATIQVERGGDIRVTESIVVRFTGSWNGIYRSIPVMYRTAQGLNWTLGLDLGGATDDEFYTELPKIKTSIFGRLLERGWYHARPDHVRARWGAGGVLLGGVLGVLGAAVADRFLLTPVPFIVAGALMALIVVGFGLVMPARTVAGARALEHVLGFEEFLRRVEAEHLKRVIIGHPELFDRFLPFAMAFGVEKKWARAFEGIYTEPPQWYVGPSGAHFSVSGFSSSLADPSGTAGSALSSSPRSSSGSGFSGGSSGGGGGGGGGGAF
ncbi:MAG: DUF2207 family protein [Gemmatimonadales bacterium]